ncbi:MAG TPA: hypothetical protein VK639_10950 [Terriglobales bacterium]|nr:hypothetical protein [Terriglobales bacterium]
MNTTMLLQQLREEVLEAVARTAYFTITINHAAQPIGSGLHDKHYLRKHGSEAYYGQPKGKK